LDYLGENSTSYNMTSLDGRDCLPLLVESISEETMPNSMPVGSYFLNMTYENATGSQFYTDGSPSFEIYPAMSESAMTDYIIVQFTDLILDRPDLVLSNIDIGHTPIYDDDDVSVTVTVENNGLTAATNFVIVLSDFCNDASEEVFNITIESLIGGDSIDVGTTWSPGTAGTHILTATADPNGTVLEESEGNNEFSIQVDVLAQLPDLSIVSDDISFDPQPAYTDSEVELSATIWNIRGRANAINASVQFYAGNPDAGGSLIGSSTVNVPSGGSNSTDGTWVPTQIGVFPIYVIVNGDHSIQEYTYTNNTASKNIAVELSPNEKTLVFENNYSEVLKGTPHPWPGNIIIRDNAELTVNGTSLNIDQETDNEYLLLMEDNATLSLINSTLTSDANLRIYLYDQSEMIVDSSVIGSTITIELHDDASLMVEESTINADIVATTDSSAGVIAVNTTFGRAWSGFGGDSVAYLTSVNAPALVAKESATIVHYRWLNVHVLDGTYASLQGAYVEVDYYNGTYYASGTSGENGYVLLQCLCDRITSTGSDYFGWYKINATYWYDGERYDSDTSPVCFDPYSPPVSRSDLISTVNISSALPDLDPPFYVSDTTPPRGEVAMMS